MYEVIVSNFLSPPLLFFSLGFLAICLRVDLKIPNSIAKFLSLYLLIAIGFQGGVELQEIGFGVKQLLPLVVAMLAATLTPLYAFFILRRVVNVYDAAAIAAVYGSVSAVTFIAAVNVLQTLHVDFGGHMVAALALMESPAIIVGLYLAQKYGEEKNSLDEDYSLFHEAFLNSSVFVILGSLLIGLITGSEGKILLKPFLYDIFKGMLSFFMLDMGLLAARRIADLKTASLVLIPFAILFPLTNGMIAMGISWMIGLSCGDTFLLAVLCASASYIAVPAALRVSVPEANPSLYLPLALGITFPFNLLIGIPLYYYMTKYIMGM